MTKAQEFELINKFMGYNGVDDVDVIHSDYSCFIGDLWPVLVKCKEVAQKDEKRLAAHWFAIAMQLNRVCLDIKDMYEQVISFIIKYFDKE